MGPAATGAERDNLPVWDGGRGHYEVWYLKLNHRETRAAFWIRYTLLAPSRAEAPALAEVWAAAFDPEDPARNVALKRTHPIAEAEIGTGRFRLRIGEAEIGHGWARGEVRAGSDRLRRDLAFDPGAETLRHFPFAAAYRLPLPSTKALAPDPDARVHGTIEWNDRHFDCAGEPGEQAHVWGSRHAECWTWGHGNLFVEDRGLVLECFTGRLRLGPVVGPPYTSVFLRREGRLHRLDSPWRALLHRSETELPCWRFAAEGDGIRLRGEARARLEDFVRVEYVDPDGERLWCHYTGVADLRLYVAAGDGAWRAFTAPRSFALEFGRRQPDPRIPAR
jgi:hypothetical protein